MEAKSDVSGGQKPLTDFEYVDFEIERENWNKYQLKDGAILKAKFILINVLAEKGFKEKIKKAKTEKEIDLGFMFQSSNVIGVEAPPNLIGEPSNTRYSPRELETSVVEDEIDFETISESWNSYKIKVNGEIYLKVRNSPIRIRRTSKFDSQGVPIYLVDFKADVKIIPKK